ncbi:MAG: nucleoside hydrolase [Acidobacteriota bacterium]|nr:nucleoside hydrolase [Acidobacteriota bacterium]
MMPGKLPRFCAIALAVLGLLHAADRPIPVILDTDIGDDIDDALALGLALQSPELEVLAITTVLNDGPRRADLVWKILQLYGRTGIPVGIGAELPLLAKPRTGIVKQTEALAPDERLPSGLRRNGLGLMIDTCMRSPVKVTIIAYGPATNVALALRAEPRLIEKLERIVLMNGVFFRPGLEYNTRMDPEASAIVYGSGVPITTVGLDVTMQCRLTTDHLQRLADSPVPGVRFLRRLISIWQSENENRLPVLHDPLAIAITVKPNLVTLASGAVEVETKGTPGRTYGMTLFHKDPAGKVQVAEEVNSAGLVDFFIERLLASPRR